MSHSVSGVSKRYSNWPDGGAEVKAFYQHRPMSDMQSDLKAAEHANSFGYVTDYNQMIKL